MYTFVKPKHPCPPLRVNGACKFQVEYFDTGEKEETFGHVWVIDKKCYFDKLDRYPDWAERYNSWRYATARVETKKELIRHLGGSKDKFLDFQKYWIVEHARRITPKFKTVRDLSNADPEAMKKYEEELAIYNNRKKIKNEQIQQSRQRIKESKSKATGENNDSN